jgi:hypothetical protein
MGCSLSVVARASTIVPTSPEVIESKASKNRGHSAIELCNKWKLIYLEFIETLEKSSVAASIWSEVN